MRYTVDRMEAHIVICEDENGSLVKLFASQLPEGVKEGDILTDISGRLQVDREETGLRRQRIKEKLKRLTE